MDRDDIIRMAREVGLDPELWNYTDAFERFASLAAAAEREACAKVVEDYCGAWDDEGYALSNAIRARGNK